MKQARRVDAVCPFCGTRVHIRVIETWTNSQYGSRTLRRRSRTRVLMQSQFANSTHDCPGPRGNQ